MSVTDWLLRGETVRAGGLGSARRHPAEGARGNEPGHKMLLVGSEAT